MSDAISAHFSWEEVTHSDTAERLGINNMIPSSLRDAAQHTADKMELVRTVLHFLPIHVDSWYRCIPLNTVLRSKLTSQHCIAEAVDFICPDFGIPTEIVRQIIASQSTIQFDQLILEYSWVHISFCAPNIVPRNSVLTLLPDGTYSKGIAK